MSGFERTQFPSARCGIEGEKAQYCKDHEVPDMISIKDYLCEEESCKNIRLLGLKKRRPNSARTTNFRV